MGNQGDLSKASPAACFFASLFAPKKEVQDCQGAHSPLIQFRGAPAGRCYTLRQHAVATLGYPSVTYGDSSPLRRGAKDWRAARLLPHLAATHRWNTWNPSGPPGQRPSAEGSQDVRAAQRMPLRGGEQRIDARRSSCPLRRGAEAYVQQARCLLRREVKDWHASQLLPSAEGNQGLAHTGASQRTPRRILHITPLQNAIFILKIAFFRIQAKILAVPSLRT